MFKQLFAVFLGCSMMLGCLPAPAKMLLPPYLQAVTTHSIYVMVESNSKAPITVEYGPTTEYGLTAATEKVLPTDADPLTYVHRILLDKLSAKATYHYRVKQDGEPTADATFGTAVNAGTPFRFAWLADTRTHTDIHAKVDKLIQAAAPRFSLYGGDLCSDGSYAMFKKEFFIPAEQALIAQVPFFNVTGNHEGWDGNTKAFIQAPASSSNTQAYYSFDYGDVHFLALNTELPFDDGSRQYQFAADDLAATKQPWKIVFMHNHPYCAGGHGGNAKLQKMAKHLFVPNKVNIVFSGHSHFFEHNLVDGIHYFIVGSAGAPLYDPQPAPYVVKSAKSYNYALVDVAPQSLKIRVNNADGKALDTLTLEK